MAHDNVIGLSIRRENEGVINISVYWEIQVNGAALSDEFSTLKIPWEMDPIRLGVNEFFVIGDNRPASVFCKVRKDDILGKTVF